MQAANIHRAGLGVFTEKEGDGKEKLFIEEVLKDGKYWRYKPRRGDATGGGCAGKLLRREGSERNGVSFGSILIGMQARGRDTVRGPREL